MSSFASRVQVNDLQRKATKAFNDELLKVIKTLMRKGVDPTHDNIVSYCRDHPADLPRISRLRTMGMEDHLRVYLYLWGKNRDSVRRKVEDADGGQVHRVLAPDGRPFGPDLA